MYYLRKLFVSFKIFNLYYSKKYCIIILLISKSNFPSFIHNIISDSYFYFYWLGQEEDDLPYYLPTPDRVLSQFSGLSNSEYCFGTQNGYEILILWYAE